MKHLNVIAFSCICFALLFAYIIFLRVSAPPLLLPGGVPYLNGNGATCTVFALANAIRDDLNQRAGRHLDIQGILAAILTTSQTDVITKGSLPTEYDGRKILNQLDTISMEYGNITIKVERASFKPGLQHVVVYSNANQEHYGLAHGPHCVFIQKCVFNQGKQEYHCINSWGATIAFPVIAANTPGVEVYHVLAEWEKAATVTPSSSISKVTKTILILLVLVCLVTSINFLCCI